MKQPIRQLAYFCADVRQAARAHHRHFGSGPYFVADNVPLSQSVHRGVERQFDHSSAYGQWAEVMIEGFVFAFVDASAAYGHMIELYSPLPALTDFYAMVADAARGWQGAIF